MAVNDITRDFPSNPGPTKEPVLPAEPITEPGPLIPEEPETPPTPAPEEPKVEEPAKLAELANTLYDSATKMQRDAEALMEAIKKDSAPNDTLLDAEQAPAPMTPEESDAASKALIGL